MTVILIASLAAATGCILYAAFRYSKSPSFNYRRAKGREMFYLYESAPLIFITYKGVPFIGECSWEGDEDRFVMTYVRLKLNNHVLDYTQWSKNDFYTIEQAIYEKHPYTEIIWDSPMKDLMML